jgi:hypothetical protein
VEANLDDISICRAHHEVLDALRDIFHVEALLALQLPGDPE